MAVASANDSFLTIKSGKKYDNDWGNTNFYERDNLKETIYSLFFEVCNLIEKEDVLAVFGVELDGGDITRVETGGYIGDLSSSILSYTGIPFIQVWVSKNSF